MTIALTKRVAGGVAGLTIGTMLALAAPISYAQTTTPQAPDTGAGAADTTLMALVVSALALAAGGAYLARRRKET